MSAEIVLLAGLPGSGKTRFMVALQQNGWLIFDDFKANAYDDSPLFWHSRSYETLLTELRMGKRCVVADIDFCKASSRDQAESNLRAQIPGLILQWRFFENDVHACRTNIVRRASRSIEDNLRALREYHLLYQIPSEAVVIPVWRPEASESVIRIVNDPETQP